METVGVSVSKLLASRTIPNVHEKVDLLEGKSNPTTKLWIILCNDHEEKIHSQDVKQQSGRLKRTM